MEISVCSNAELVNQFDVYGKLRRNCYREVPCEIPPTGPDRKTALGCRVGLLLPLRVLLHVLPLLLLLLQLLLDLRSRVISGSECWVYS